MWSNIEPREEQRSISRNTRNTRNTRNHVINTSTLYKGSIYTSVIRTTEIFSEPICLNASVIIIAHNHSSGDPKPSPEDVHTTVSSTTLPTSSTSNS